MVTERRKNPLEADMDHLCEICLSVSGLMAAREIGPNASVLLEDDALAHAIVNSAMRKFQNVFIANPPPGRDASKLCDWYANLLRAVADIIPKPIVEPQ